VFLPLGWHGLSSALCGLALFPLQVGASLAAQAGLTLGYHALAFIALMRNGPRMQPLSKLGGASVKPEKAGDAHALPPAKVVTDAAEPLCACR